MTKAITEFKDKFYVDFPIELDIPKEFREVDFWRKCCFECIPAKLKVLEYLYLPKPKSSVPRESTYPIIQKLGYSRKRAIQIIDELRDRGFFTRENGTILTHKNQFVQKNIRNMLLLAPLAKNPEKIKGLAKDQKLRYYLPFIVDVEWRPLSYIVRKYCESHGTVSRAHVQRALDENVDKTYDRKEESKGKYKAVYYRLIH